MITREREERQMDALRKYIGVNLNELMLCQHFHHISRYSLQVNSEVYQVNFLKNFDLWVQKLFHVIFFLLNHQTATGESKNKNKRQQAMKTSCSCSDEGCSQFE